MKKIIMTCIALLFMVATQAQQRNGGNELRDRLENLMATEDQHVLEQKLNDLKKSKTEDDQMLAYYYYSSKRMVDEAEATRALILTSYPHGQLAIREKLQSISELSSTEEKEKLFLELYENYPDQNFGFIPFSLAREFAEKGDEEKMKFYVDIFVKSGTDSKGEPLKKDLIYSQVARGLISTKPDKAAEYLKPGFEEAKSTLGELLADPNPDPNLLMHSRRSYFSAWNGYSSALLKGSNPEEGYIFIAETYNTFKDDPKIDANIFSLIQNQYINALIATKRFKEAFPLMEDAIRNDAASEMIRTNLEEAYVASKGSSKGFEEYRKELLRQQEEKFLADIVKTAINVEAPDFVLKDVDGNTVKLSDLAGKVVILDFWATWCGPCKASFPSMQQAVNKYENDPKVKFLFIHTWDNGGDDVTGEAKKYITDNKFTFEVLMDLRNPENRKSAVASAYELEGLPTKVIIDPKGKIRFKTAGFSADAEKAVKELSAMIDYLKG